MVLEERAIIEKPPRSPWTPCRLRSTASSRGRPSTRTRGGCYHPLLVRWSRGDLLGAWLRPGNAHTAEGGLAFVLPTLRWAKRRTLRLWLRTDAGFPIPPTGRSGLGERSSNDSATAGPHAARLEPFF